MSLPDSRQAQPDALRQLFFALFLCGGIENRILHLEISLTDNNDCNTFGSKT